MSRVECHIRWLISRDMEQVLSIERENYSSPWGEETILAHIKQTNCIGMVAELGNRVIGYMIYDLHDFYIDIASFAVLPSFADMEIDTQLLEKLKIKFSLKRRWMLNIKVREINFSRFSFWIKNNFFIQTTEEHLAWLSRIPNPQKWDYLVDNSLEGCELSFVLPEIAKSKGITHG